MLIVNPTGSDNMAVTATSAQSSVIMGAGAFVRVICTVACYVAQGADPTASAADGSVYLAAGQELWLSGKNGAKVAIVRASGDGTAIVSPASYGG